MKAVTRMGGQPLLHVGMGIAHSTEVAAILRVLQ